jgi:K+-sensing histidine kinase KdpD
VDVVVGVVETHGRKETEALLDGFEILPRKPTVYVNRILDEFDIDAALKRRPSLILVDELAHTNVPGSRHPKRYQDVEELLDAGIDVYTTVNIQHIESLNDVVAQITRVRVREIVPDDILDRAEAIKLVDLTPDELIERLKEGKVYVPAQAERALKHYFSPANLTALRELALRRTAERVDEQLLEQMQARAIPGPWAAGERILVCVSEDPRSPGLVRYAKRLADRLRAPWTALCVETTRSLQFGDAERDRIAEALRLAERLDGEAVTIPAKARRIADDVISFAQKNNVTHIVLGKLLLPGNGSIVVKVGFPPEDRLDEADLAAAKWAWEQSRPAERDSDALPGAKWLFLPMRTGRGPIGIVGICRDEPGALLRPEQRRLLDALADQGALAIERVHLVQDIERVRREAEADRLRSALLTSISHDSEHRWRPCSVRREPCATCRSPSTMPPRPISWHPSSMNRSGSTASSPICST